MRWRLLAVCSLAAAAQAGDYERAIDDTRRVLSDESMPMGQRLDVQYERLADVGLKEPNRWEVFFERGQNRCKRAFFHRGDVDAFIARGRATGLDDQGLAQVKAEAAQQIQAWIGEAHREFSVAEAVMARRGEWRADHELLLFANASMKFAGREYLRAQQGQSGAIDDFKALIQRNFIPDRCGDHIALCYLDLGHEAYMRQEYEAAQRAWDEGLQWTKQAYLQGLLWTNKAGAYEMDHNYELAEDVLHRQIAAAPSRPEHHRNLGLVLGYQNRLKEALYHYDTARELCRRSGDLALALKNGNAWLRPAVIHGTLLERDGDLRLGWRLFLEYRQLFGDDYNFCLWFGDFAKAQGAYDLAFRYIEHARDLQPRCAVPYQKLVEIAPRTSGTREEVEVRTKAATQSLFDAQARYYVADESPAVMKICGGVADMGDLGVPGQPAGLLEPDPLAGFDMEHPPPWVEKAAKSRDPFVPFDPASVRTKEPGSRQPGGGATSWAVVAASVGAVLLVIVMALRFVFQRRKA